LHLENVRIQGLFCAYGPSTVRLLQWVHPAGQIEAHSCLQNTSPSELYQVSSTKRWHGCISALASSELHSSTTQSIPHPAADALHPTLQYHVLAIATASV
jgi:hypothetical protein